MDTAITRNRMKSVLLTLVCGLLQCSHAFFSKEPDAQDLDRSSVSGCS